MFIMLSSCNKSSTTTTNTETLHPLYNESHLTLNFNYTHIDAIYEIDNQTLVHYQNGSHDYLALINQSNEILWTKGPYNFGSIINILNGIITDSSAGTIDIMKFDLSGDTVWQFENYTKVNDISQPISCFKNQESHMVCLNNYGDLIYDKSTLKNIEYLTNDNSSYFAYNYTDEEEHLSFKLINELGQELINLEQHVYHVKITDNFIYLFCNHRIFKYSLEGELVFEINNDVNHEYNYRIELFSETGDIFY